MSVRPSVTRRYSVKMAKHIIKHFHHRVATPFQLFHTERYSNMYHRCLPLTGASNAVVVKKIAIFDLYFSLSLKQYKTEP